MQVVPDQSVEQEPPGHPAGGVHVAVARSGPVRVDHAELGDRVGQPFLAGRAGHQVEPPAVQPGLQVVQGQEAECPLPLVPAGVGRCRILLEEPVESDRVAALRSPHHNTAVVVDDKGQVPVMLTPRDLIDSDTEQPVQPVRVQLGRDDAFTGPPDGPPRHPSEAGDRGLVHAGREPSEQVVVVAGQMRSGPGERDSFDHDPVGWAREATEPAADLERPGAEIEVTPRRRLDPGVVTRGCRERTMRAQQPTALQRDRDRHNLGLELDIGDVELSVVVSDAVEAASRTALGKQIKLIDGVGELPDVRGDADRLGQLLDNLISNAIRYTPEGGQISVESELDVEWVELRVRDSGIGIPAAELARVFDRFFRTSRSQTMVASGAGLGLAICKSIVETHGGTIELESVENQGTTVIVRLPVEGAAN